MKQERADLLALDLGGGVLQRFEPQDMVVLLGCLNLILQQFLHLDHVDGWLVGLLGTFGFAAPL